MTDVDPEGYDDIVKVVFLGDYGVGKTTFINNILGRTMGSSYMPTIGIDFQYHIYTYRNRVTKFQLWDTAGNERFRVVTFSFLRGANIIVLMFDYTNKTSFQNLEASWLQTIDSYIDPESKIQLMIVGTKYNSEKCEVSAQEAGEFAKIHSAEFLSVDCTTKLNVDNFFEYLASVHHKSLIVPILPDRQPSIFDLFCCRK